MPTVALWGTGSPRREFLFSDDLADACIFLINRLDDLFIEGTGSTGFRSGASRRESSFASDHLINIGYGEDLTIRELAELVAGIVGFDGPVEWDHTKPDGTPQKLLDVSRITSLGWKPKTSLAEGIRLAYEDYLDKGKA
jgi:GDP-L-fucose synthase